MSPNSCFFARLGIAVLVMVGVSIETSAHIVPVEQFHPMVESYRRLAFSVNLNPVRWDEVEKDARVIAKELSMIDSDRGSVYARNSSAVIEMVRAEAAVSLATPTMRRKSSKALFELSTEALAHGLAAHLAYARSQITNYEEALSHFEIARYIFVAFEHELKATDSAMHRELGFAWLDASSALGSPGLLGVGTIPADVERFGDASKTITEYILANYGSKYEANPSRWMYPVPYRSASYDASASIPVKLAPGSDLNKQLPRPRQILNMVERGVNEMDTPLIAFGDLAFDSPYIFGDPARSLQMSCNTCHNKGTTSAGLFIAGLSSAAGGLDASNNFFAPHANNGHFDPVDVPDLRGIRFTAPYGRNGRFTSLREFTRNVITNEFNGPEPDPVLMDALIAYMNEFDFLPNAQMTKHGKLNDTASDSAKRGEVLFSKPYAQMNDMSCASCHIPSNHFIDGLRHDVGSAGGSSEYSMDRALDTPTLLSVLNTPPYMHNGSLATLPEVIDFFDTEYSLELTNGEKSDLNAYLEAIGGGDEPFEDSIYTLEPEMEEFSFFLSSYEYVKGLNKPDMVSMIFETISAEIQAHKWDVQDTSHLGTLDKMASLMDKAYIANEQGETEQVDALVDEYRAMYAEHADVLK